jgi:hypothetical protein
LIDEQGVAISSGLSAVSVMVVLAGGFCIFEIVAAFHLGT